MTGPDAGWQIRRCEMAATGADYVVVLIESYFDESCTNGDDVVQCIAGYMIESEQAKIMTEEWIAVLKKYDLPFFHMVECAHRNKNFKKYREEKDDITPAIIAKTLIDIIKSRVRCGAVVMFNPRVFEGLGNGPDEFEDLYVGAVKFLTISAIGEGKVVQNREGAKDVSLSISFESGHPSAGLARTALSELANSHAEIIRYAFEDKRNTPLLQAADILAWQSTKYVKCVLEKRKIRADFSSLVQKGHVFAHMMNVRAADQSRIGTQVFHGDPLINTANWEHVINLVYARGSDVIMHGTPFESGRPFMRFVPV